MESEKFNSFSSLRRESECIGVGAIKTDEKLLKESLAVLQHHL